MKSFLFAIVSLLLTASVAAAQSSYTVRPGDTLQVEVLEDPSLNRSVLVLPDGTISFPFAGSVQASGRTAGEIGSAITSGISSNFASQPNVFVTVETLNTARSTTSAGPATVRVYMMGEIGAPGEKKLRRGITLVQALAETGGFTQFAATKRIVLRRTNPRTGKASTYKINYKSIAAGGAGRDIRLQNGDVIIVPQRRLFE